MTKTMSIRMDRENYEFLARLSKEERGDLSGGAGVGFSRQNSACRGNIQET
jgi:hypothetical protein